MAVQGSWPAFCRRSRERPPHKGVPCPCQGERGSSIAGDNDHHEKSRDHRAAYRWHFAGNRAKRPTDRRPTTCPRGGTTRTGRHSSRRNGGLQSPVGGSEVGGSSDEGLVAYPHRASSDQAPPKDVHVGQGRPPKTSKRQFALADDAQAINFKQSLGPLGEVRGFFISFAFAISRRSLPHAAVVLHQPAKPIWRR